MHDVRHTFAVHAVQSGVPIPRLQRLLGPAVTAKGPRYSITDPHAVADVLKRAIDRGYGGNRRAAALAVGIPNSTLLAASIDERRNTIRYETLLRLLKLVGRKGKSKLLGALLTPTAETIFKLYRTWVLTQTYEAFLGIVGRDQAMLGFAKREVVIDAKRIADIRREVRDRERRFGDLAVSLRERFPGEWQPLYGRFDTTRHSDDRLVLAVAEVVRPLLNYELSGTVERGAHELSERELRRFIRAGVVREGIMLDRDTAVRRMQDHAADYRRRLREVRRRPLRFAGRLGERATG